MTDAAAPATTGFNSRWLMIGIALLLSALVVILVARFPLGIAFDYPNHLAQYHIEVNFRDPNIEKYYAFQFRLVPNLAADMLVVPLSSIVGLYTAGAFAIGLAVLVLALSGMWLKYLLGDKQFSWSYFFMFVPIFNFSFFYGFLNYSLGSGFAIFFFASWIALRSRVRVRSIVFMAMSVLLFFAHALGLFLLIYMVVLYELGTATTRGGINRSTVANLFRQFATFVPGLILLIWLFIFSDAVNPAREFTMRWPLWSLMSPFAIPNHSFSQNYYHKFSSILPFVMFILFFYVSMREKFIYIEREKIPLVVGMLTLATFMPHQMMSIAFLDMRFATPFVIIFVACAKVWNQSVGCRLTGTAIVSAIISMQFASAFLAMRTTHEQAKVVRELFQALPHGKKLLTVVNSDPTAQPYGHFHGYAVVERDAFSPNIFVNSSIIMITEEQAHLSFDDWPIDEEDLAVAVNRKSPTPGSISSAAYFFGWEANFDYLFYVRGQDGKPLSYSCLALIREEPRFALYEVKKPDAGEPCRQL